MPCQWVALQQFRQDVQTTAIFVYVVGADNSEHQMAKRRYQRFLENTQLFVRSIQLENGKVLKECQQCLLEDVPSG